VRGGIASGGERSSTLIALSDQRGTGDVDASPRQLPAPKGRSA